MGPRKKASDALAAWNGDKPSLGDRVDATREAAAEVMAQQDATTAVEPAPTSARARPMPPEGSEGSWVWVRLPDGAGEVCVRAEQWIRVTPSPLCPGGWALHVSCPGWRLLDLWDGAGGRTADVTYEGQIVPSTMVEQVPGHWSGVPYEGQSDGDSKV